LVFAVSACCEAFIVGFAGAAADLIAHRFDPDSAADLLVDAHNKGLRDGRLLDVAVAADHELQRGGGRTPSEALAHVRALLPNVPAPNRP